MNFKEMFRKTVFLMQKNIFMISCKISDKFARELFIATTENYQAFSKKYISYISRPRKAKDFTQNTLSNVENKFLVGVVIQGAISVEDDFTLETVKLYKKKLKNAIIIVSTWSNTEKDIICRLKENGAYIVMSDDPRENGLYNINRQVISSMAGIKKAKELGCTHILKTRSDQRFYKADLDCSLYSLQKKFSLSDDTVINQAHRIIVLQGTVGINIYRPFFVSDFMYFGDINDIYNMFDNDLYDKRRFTTVQQNEYVKKVKDNCSVGKYLIECSPEVKIFYSYVKKYINNNIEYTVKDYWAVIKDNFICVSNEEMGFYWPKYKSHFWENTIRLNYLEKDNNDNIETDTWNFFTWLNLYMDMITYKETYEIYKDIPAYKI